jgi:catechol 2,3-dioxygenase-like lactoylglutathione lyase family enzyme
MQVEHIAWQVPDPVALAEWYTHHLGFQVVRRGKGPTLAHFLADASGRVVIEVYHNPAASIPDYPAQSPLILHLAFAVPDLAAARDCLLSAGAALAEDISTTPAGDQLAMLRDPWGFPLQLVKRLSPMLQ